MAISLNMPWRNRQAQVQKGNIEVNQEQHNRGHGSDGHPHHHHERLHEVTIVVNGKEKHWDKERITYDELVKLSGEPLPPGPDAGFTITYFNGPHEKPEGSVEPGHSVKVKEGMVFVVTPTHRS